MKMVLSTNDATLGPIRKKMAEVTQLPLRRKQLLKAWAHGDEWI